MRAYLKSVVEWATPGYRFAVETLIELTILAGHAAMWLLRLVLAVLLFPVWLAAQMAKRAAQFWQKGCDG